MLQIKDKNECIETVYNQITGVDINEQKELWDERGKGYYGEFVLFERLYQHVRGNFKILMNVNVPKSEDCEDTTEIDLLMIHETGIYIFECKHYKGIIYGNSKDPYWTQFFKTQKNEHFYNPILQNEGHRKAIQSLFPSVKAFSYIVFTRDDCELNVKYDRKQACVCELSDICSLIGEHTKIRDKVLNIEQIDDIFNQLAIYSAMQETARGIDATEKPFADWLSPVINSFKESKNQYEEEAERARKKRLSYKIRSIGIIVVCLICTICFCFFAEKRYEQGLADNFNAYNATMKEILYDFSHPQQLQNDQEGSEESPSITIRYEQIYSVSDVHITGKQYGPTDGVYEGVSFTAMLKAISKKYGFKLTPQSQYIVTTTDGSTYMYSVFENQSEYIEKYNTLAGYATEGQLKKKVFTGIMSPNNIASIKLNNVECFEIHTGETIGHFEIKLYKTS